MKSLSRFTQRLRNGIVWLTWLMTIWLIIFQALRVYPGDAWLPVRWTNYAAPLLFMLSAFALLGAYVLRQKKLVLALLIPVLIFGVRFAPLWAPKAVAAGTSARGL